MLALFVLGDYCCDFEGGNFDSSLRASPTQTPDSKIYCEKVKMCQFCSGNWFFCIKFVQLGVDGKRHNTVVHLQKRV
jgi:hypothetical protein